MHILFRNSDSVLSWANDLYCLLKYDIGYANVVLYYVYL